MKAVRGWGRGARGREEKKMVKIIEKQTETVSVEKRRKKNVVYRSVITEHVSAPLWNRRSWFALF